jgi:hypothetical protein
MSPMKVEFIKCYDDNTWDTEVIEVPDGVADNVPVSSGGEWDAAVLNWAHANLPPLTQYRNVVFWGIYNTNPEEEP